jgi:hypothetical protein
MLTDGRHSLTERVTVNFSPAQLERLERYLQRYGENLGGFIRRAALEKLDQLGVPAEREGLGDLLGDVKRGSIQALNVQPAALGELQSRIENYSLRSSGGR